MLTQMVVNRGHSVAGNNLRRVSLGEVLAVVLFRIEAEVWVRRGAIPVLE